MSDITIQVPESEYNSILRQAVAVIDKTRNIVAASVTSAIGSAHWELGKLLHDKTMRTGLSELYFVQKRIKLRSSWLLRI